MQSNGTFQYGHWAPIIWPIAQKRGKGYELATTQPTTQNIKTQLGWCGIIIGKTPTTPSPHHDVITF